MNFLEKIEEKIFDWVLLALGHLLGYLICYKSNVDNLKTQVEELRGARDRLQHDVDTALRNLMKIEDDVKRRLIESDDIIAVAEEILEDDNRGWYLNMMSRYQVSKRADKAASEAKNLKDEISKINSVGYREPTQVVETVTSNRGYEAFESRMPTITGVLEALKDHNFTRIGIHGMGGIGKTMLVKEVLKQAEKDKLFDKYLFLVVSKDPDLKSIQREIAEQLDLEFEKESELVRRDQLRKQLKQENRVLIILDDIWKTLDLETLGIFFGDDQKGCKLLLTSRLQNTLRDMGTQQQFPVGVLSDNEAISLFEKIVGDLTGEFKSNMPQIVKECAGLPIAITAVASALKNRKNIDVWKHALNRLKMSRPIKIVGTDEKVVYKSIKLSYEFLPDEEKSLLLLCSLHGEDYNIMIEDLLKYAVGWDLLKDDHEIEGARVTVRKLVEGLKDSCLLLGGADNRTVKMHDVIRDVVINIASDEKHMLPIRTATELQNLFKREDAVAISVPYINDDLELPDRFDCSKLVLLLLFNQGVGFRIPDSFFEGLKDLKVLKLSKSWSGVLPSSLSSLENLQTLCLEGDVQNAIIIGELKNLKALSLSLSDTERLPKEIGQLTHLQLLDLGECSKLKFIPPNVLSNLKRLEELYLPNDVELEIEAQSTERINAMFSELGHLSHLTKLHICIENAKIRPNAIVFKRLNSYRIAIGSAWVSGETSETSRILKLKTTFQSDYGYNVLFRECETLILDGMKGVKNNLYELDSEGFQSLKHLTVQSDDEIVYILTSVGVLDSVFPSLESITLRNVNNLERICYMRLPKKTFCNLGVVNVRDCCKLKFLFSSSMVGCFSHLQEMNIEDCEIMSAIVEMEREEEIEVNSHEIIMFANLRSLKLWKLSKLKGFLPVGDSLVLFDGKIEAQSTERINAMFSELDHLSQLTKLHICIGNAKILPNNRVFERLESYRIAIGSAWIEDETSETSRMLKLNISFQSDCGYKVLFRKCETLILDKMKGVKNNLYELDSEGFQSLKHFIVQDNDEIQYIFKSMGVLDSVFPSLESITILNVNNLERISYTQLPTESFCNLRVVKVRGCCKLEFVFSSSMVKCFSHLQEMNIEDCKIMSAIVEIEREEIEVKNDDNIMFADLHSLKLRNLFKLKGFLSVVDSLELFNEKVVYPNLEELEIKGMDSMKMIWPNQLISNSFGKLRTVDIEGFSNLKSVFPTSVAKALMQLEKLWIKRCATVEEIIAKEEGIETTTLFEFPQLKILTLVNLPELKSFHQGKHILECSLLNYLYILQCDKLKIFGSNKSSVQETNGLAYHANLIQQPLFFIEKDKFPNLKNLTLDDAMNETCGGPSAEFCCNLKELTLIGNGEIPNVEAPIARVGVSDIRRLKNIVPFSSTSFHYLQTLVVHGSDVLISLLTPSTARTLVQLRLIMIWGCKRMTEIVANEGSEAKTGDEIAFNNLTSFQICMLPSLTAFHLGNCPIKFPSLDEVMVRECPKLKIFCSGVLSTPKLRLIRMEGEWIHKNKGGGDLDLKATIKEYWETCNQKFAEKTDASDGEKSEHDANDDL